MTTAELSALLGFVFLSLGVSVSTSEFVGGMFMCIAMAFLLMAWSQPEDRKSYWLTLVTATMFGLITAAAHDHVLSSWSPQVKMAASGAMSKWIAEGIIGFGRSMKDQLALIPAAIKDRYISSKPKPPPSDPDDQRKG